MKTKILEIKNLSFYYENLSVDNKWKQIIKNITFEVNEGEIVGLVGLSGCGKTTLGKLLVDYFTLNNISYKMTGEINYSKKDRTISIPSKDYSKINIPPIQMVFQDPRTSLNMKMPVYDQLKESILLKYKKNNINAINIDKDIKDLASKLKISEKLLKYLPTDMSGGQRRRFGLAKIMAMDPKIIIADEPVASLDVSIKEQIMDVIFDLNKIDNVSLVIISHDISLLMKRAHRILVMHEGELVEAWDPKSPPVHQATKDLLDDSNYVNEVINND